MKKKLVIAARLFVMLISFLLVIYGVISWFNIITNNTGLGNGIYEWNIFRLILARG